MAQFQNTSSKMVRTSDTTSASTYMTESETVIPRQDTGDTHRTSDSYYDTTTTATNGQTYAQMYPPQYVDPRYLPSAVTVDTAATTATTLAPLGRRAHGPRPRSRPRPRPRRPRPKPRPKPIHMPRPGNVKATFQPSKTKNNETSHFNDPMCCAADVKVVIYSLNTCLTCVVIMSFVVIVAFHDIIGIAAGGAGFYVTLKFLLYTGCTFATHRRGWKLLLLTVILIMMFMLIDVILTVVVAANVMTLDDGKYKLVEGIKAVLSSLAWALGISFVSAHCSLICACIRFIRHLRKHGRGKLSADDDFWHAIID